MNRTFLAFATLLTLSVQGFAQSTPVDPDCPPEHEAMGHCKPKQAPVQAQGDGHFHAHLNQFVVFGNGSGPRARSGFTAPNMFMLEVEKGFLKPRNSFKVEFMGTTDRWTTPAAGTPQLLQTGEADENGRPYIDAQHPHSSPVMGLTFSNILKLNEDGSKKLTFFFAPRGEATAGPDTFMHRQSAAGNPDAPLSHHLQDFFHISSTVAGVKLNYGKVSVEGSAFSGFEPQPRKVNLDMHKPDSYAFRAKYKFNDFATVGGSIANVKPQHAEVPTGHSEPAQGEIGHGELEHVPDEPAHGSENQRAVVTAAWLTTQNEIGSGTLHNTVIWGHVQSEESLNGFLEEFVYNLGKNNFIGRVEVLQRTPDQLQIEVTPHGGKKWISALTIGYERKIFTKQNVNTYLAGTYTQTFIPGSWSPAYGSSSPRSFKVFMRLGWSHMNMFGNKAKK